MVRVDFLGPIGLDSMHLDVASLKELREILSQDPRVLKWLESSAIAVNDELVDDIDLKLDSGSVVSLLPPVCGG